MIRCFPILRSIMFNINKKLKIALMITLSLLCFTGCGTKDKTDIKEATQSFIEGLKVGDTTAINEYSSDEVATGNFVELYDSNYLKEYLVSGLGDFEVADETTERLDKFQTLYSTMLEEYEITDVTLNDDGTATAYVTIKNSFPYDIVTDENIKDKVHQASETYIEENQDEISAIIKDEGEDAAKNKTYNDIIIAALDIYEEEINHSEPITYMLAISLSKNEETGSWYVTGIQSYDSSIAGTGAPATETDTTATEISVDESSAALSAAENSSAEEASEDESNVSSTSGN